MDRPYRWAPAHASQNKHFFGRHITTLHISVDVEGATWQDMPMAAGAFQAVRERSPRACLAGGSVVFCRGMVAGVCPQGHNRPESGPEVHDASIAQLPEGMRPLRPLCFAAVSRDSRDELVALVVRPDGWVQGFGRGQAAGVLDLSAVRFSIDRGIALVDEVRMHTCDFAGIRMVMLQGHLATRSFKVHTDTRLGLLPKACRPHSDQAFVVAGVRAGNFHLVIAQSSEAFGVGGELIWADSLWRYADEINLSGIIYVASAEAMRLSLDYSETGHNRKVIVVTEFQDYIRRKYGSIERAWYEAFDLDGNGCINFTEFGFGCKKAGYVGNIGRVWGLLDTNQSGEITKDELDVVVGKPEVTRKVY